MVVGVVSAVVVYFLTSGRERKPRPTTSKLELTGVAHHLLAALLLLGLILHVSLYGFSSTLNILAMFS